MRERPTDDGYSFLYVPFITCRALPSPRQDPGVQPRRTRLLLHAFGLQSSTTSTALL